MGFRFFLFIQKVEIIIFLLQHRGFIFFFFSSLHIFLLAHASGNTLTRSNSSQVLIYYSNWFHPSPLIYFFCYFFLFWYNFTFIITLRAFSRKKNSTSRFFCWGSLFALRVRSSIYILATRFDWVFVFVFFGWTYALAINVNNSYYLPQSSSSIGNYSTLISKSCLVLIWLEQFSVSFTLTCVFFYKGIHFFSVKV